MKVPTRGEQRLAALLNEAAEPMDPVVSPGEALTQRARRRTRRRRTAVVAAAMATVLAVGGTAVWLDEEMRSSGPVAPAGEAGDGGEVAADRVAGGALDALDVETLERADGRASETLVRLLGNPGGHTALTVDSYVYGLEWLWYSNYYRLSWVRPTDVPPEDIQIVPLEDWSSVMAQCISGHGYDATVQDGVPWVQQDLRDIDLAWHARRCAIANQPEWAYADFSREDWAAVYDYLETDWRTCEEQSGSPVYWLIEREEFLDQASRGPLTQRISNLDERLAGSDCPQVPDHLRNGVTGR